MLIFLGRKDLQKTTTLKQGFRLKRLLPWSTEATPEAVFIEAGSFGGRLANANHRHEVPDQATRSKGVVWVVLGGWPCGGLVVGGSFPCDLRTSSADVWSCGLLGGWVVPVGNEQHQMVVSFPVSLKPASKQDKLKKHKNITNTNRFFSCFFSIFSNFFHVFFPFPGHLSFFFRFAPQWPDAAGGAAGGAALGGAGSGDLETPKGMPFGGLILGDFWGIFGDFWWDFWGIFGRFWWVLGGFLVIFGDFWEIFGGFLGDFWWFLVIFGGFLGDFWGIFGDFWEIFGGFLGDFLGGIEAISDFLVGFMYLKTQPKGIPGSWYKAILWSLLKIRY